MKFLLPLLTAALVQAQSNPSWWKYVPLESAAIVGVQWNALQATPFGPVLAADVAPGGSLGFPDLELLRKPEQLVIGSPTLLAVAYGTFPIEKLRAQAEAKGLKKFAFRPAELYVSSDPAVLSVAYISERLLLVGKRQDLEDAITRVSNPKERAYSPLLARAARYSKEDLWVVASRLPDPLASRFLPLDIEATAFEGSASAWDGLHVVASVERATPLKALDFADSLAESLASRPAMAEATEITTRDRSVLIRMDLDEEQLAASLRVPAPVARPIQDPHPVLVSAAVPAKMPARALVPPPTAPTTAKPTPVAITDAVPEIAVTPFLMPALRGAAFPPPPPKTIKIMGLDSGPREIPLGR